MTDVCREFAAANLQEDPLESGKQWGMIQNRNVKVCSPLLLLRVMCSLEWQRRTGARPPPAPTTTAPKPKPESTVPAKRPLQNEAPAKSEPKAEESKPQPSTANGSQPSKSAGKPAPPKREKGNLFSSFAKAKPKQKTENSEGSVSTDTRCIIVSDTDPWFQATPSAAGDGLSHVIPCNPPATHTLQWSWTMRPRKNPKSCSPTPETKARLRIAKVRRTAKKSSRR